MNLISGIDDGLDYALFFDRYITENNLCLDSVGSLPKHIMATNGVVSTKTPVFKSEYLLKNCVDLFVGRCLK